MSAGLRVMQNGYMDTFPNEVPIKAIQGFVVTAVINLAFEVPARLALLGGGIAAIATIVEAVTRPIIKAIFPENPKIGKCIQLIFPQMAALGLAASVTPWLGFSFKPTAILIRLIPWFALNERFYEKNVGLVHVL